MTAGGWHNLLRYGMARKREEAITFYPAGIPITTTSFGFTSTNYYGYATAITGANGYSVNGQALMNYEGTYPNNYELVSNRDELTYQSDYLASIILSWGCWASNMRRGRAAPKKFPTYGINGNGGARQLRLHGSDSRRLSQPHLLFAGRGRRKKSTLRNCRNAAYRARILPSSSLAGAYFTGTELKFNFANGYQEPTLDDQRSARFTTFCLANLEG